MPSYFTVVKYVPNIVRDERVNIGVIAFSETDTRAIFLENWHRVKCLGGNPSSIKAACVDLENMDVERLRKAAREWTHSIQLSRPSASLLDMNTLLLDTAQKFLVDPEVTERGYKSKADVLRRVKQSLREAVTRNLGTGARKLIRDDAIPSFPGALEIHAFDIYALNGKPIFGANAISFEVPNQKSLRRQIDATKWAIEDLKSGDGDAEIAVILSKPSIENRELYDQSLEVLRKLEANVQHDTDLEVWSEGIADSIRSHLPEYLRKNRHVE